jgi:hypothetical protein
MEGEVYPAPPRREMRGMHILTEQAVETVRRHLGGGERTTLRLQLVR